MTTDVKYYGIPGRGEAVRLMLKLKGTKYTETYIDSKTWKAGEKENTKWNVMPVITLENGQVAGMSRSILRYIAKTTYVEGNPLYPTDPNDALVVDEVMDFLGEDIWMEMLKSVGEKNGEEIAKNTLASGGKAFLQLNELEKNIEGTDSTLKNGNLSVADIYIYAAIGWYSSGFMTKETNAQSLFTGRPKLSAICTRVGALAAVKAHQTDANNKIAMKQAYMTAPWSSKL